MSQLTDLNMTVARMWACLLLLVCLTQHVKCTGSSTASYEELLSAVKAGTFEVKKPVRLPDTNSQDLLEKILEKSKIIYIANLRIKITPCLVGDYDMCKAITTLCKAITETVKQ